MNKINSKKEILNVLNFEEVYQYYIIENHPKSDCYMHFNVTERSFRAFLEHYNLKKPKKLVRILSDKTKEEKYHDKNYNNKQKIMETCVERYNATSPLSNKEIHAKTISTQIEKYGATGFGLKTKEERIYLAKKANAALWDKYHQDEHFAQKYQNSQNSTKTKNKSFNTSNREKLLYKQLCNKYGVDNVVEQYRDDRYPFNCDFYIKPEDLFIELNAHWSHGPHPFNEQDPADISLLQKWQEKAKYSKFYRNAIDTWTIRDPNKLKYFIDNKLNFMLLYNNTEVTLNDYKY